MLLYTCILDKSLFTRYKRTRPCLSGRVVPKLAERAPSLDLKFDVSALAWEYRFLYTVIDIRSKSHNSLCLHF